MAPNCGAHICYQKECTDPLPQRVLGNLRCAKSTLQTEAGVTPNDRLNTLWQRPATLFRPCSSDSRLEYPPESRFPITLSAYREIERHHEHLYRFLKNHIRTGNHCQYDPDDAVTWEL